MIFEGRIFRDVLSAAVCVVSIRRLKSLGLRSGNCGGSDESAEMVEGYRDSVDEQGGNYVEVDGVFCEYASRLVLGDERHGSISLHLNNMTGDQDKIFL